MRSSFWLLAWVLLLTDACTCGPTDLSGRTFACAAGTDCAEGFECVGGLCRERSAPPAPAALGTPCSSATRCASGFCEHGVCCERACPGPCESCGLPTSPGSCLPLPMGAPGEPACAPLACDGAHSSCPTGCPSCRSDQACIGVRCVDLKALGVSCVGGAECGSSRCVDGVCCDSACSGACDACNLAGHLGTCTPTAAGTAGAPTCSPRVCDGLAPGCPTTCSSPQQCIATASCTAGECLIKLETLSDDFNDNARDASLWNAMNTGARVRERNGQLELDIPQSSNAYVGYTSVSHYDAVDSHLSVQLKSAGNQALSSLEAVTSLRKDPSNRVSVVVGNHLLTVRKTVAAVQTNLYSTAYDPIAMAYLRIREAQGVTFFEVAPDGVTYSPLYLVADPFDLSVVTVTLSAGTFRDETSNSLVVFDNVNLP